MGAPAVGTGEEERVLCQQAAFRSMSRKTGLKTWVINELMFVQSVGA
jgi:hypothetical protein